MGLANEFNWSLYNSVDARKIDSLNTNQVELVLLVLPDHEKQSWKFWREGMSEWQPLLDFVKLRTPTRQTRREFHLGDIEQNKRKIEKLHDPTLELEVDANADSGLSFDENVVRQLYERKDSENPFVVNIEIWDLKFETTTLDVSMDGIHLIRELPAWVPHFFPIVITHGDSSIRIIASRLKLNDKYSKTRLKIEENYSRQQLRTWLIDSGELTEKANPNDDV